MKELTNEEVNGLLLVAGHDWRAAIKDAYRLGQIHGIAPVRFQAACAALTGYVAAGANGMPEPEQLAYYSVSAADALIAELNRTASDAEKGGEG